MRSLRLPITVFVVLLAPVSHGAEQGFAAARYHLGVKYLYGDGVPEDYVQAYAWLNLARAADNGLTDEIFTELKGHMTQEQIAEGQKQSQKILDRNKTNVNNVEVKQ